MRFSVRQIMLILFVAPLAPLLLASQRDRGRPSASSGPLRVSRSGPSHAHIRARSQRTSVCDFRARRILLNVSGDISLPGRGSCFTVAGHPLFRRTSSVTADKWVLRRFRIGRCLWPERANTTKDAYLSSSRAFLSRERIKPSSSSAGPPANRSRVGLDLVIICLPSGAISPRPSSRRVFFSSSMEMNKSSRDRKALVHHRDLK